MTVIQKQLLLAYLGCLPVAGVDGIWGPESEQALKEAQKRMDIDADGIWGRETEEKIRSCIAAAKELVGEEPRGFWAHIRYWTREEFRCRCGEYHEPYCDGFPAEPDQILVELADDIRKDFGAPGYRSSGLRCQRHNSDEGGVANSRHLRGKALDFRIEGVSGEALLERAKKDPRTR